jgi:hypothetical protein
MLAGRNSEKLSELGPKTMAVCLVRRGKGSLT